MPVEIQGMGPTKNFPFGMASVTGSCCVMVGRGGGGPLSGPIPHKSPEGEFSRRPAKDTCRSEEVLRRERESTVGEDWFWSGIRGDPHRV